MIIPPDMETWYNRFLSGRGDVVDSLNSFLGEDSGARTRDGAWAAFILSRIYFVQGKLNPAQSYLRRSFRIFHSLEENEYPLGLWVNRALIFKHRGEYLRASKLLRSVCRLSLRRKDLLSAAKASSNLASILARRGSLEESLRYLNLAENIYDALGGEKENLFLKLTRSVLDIRRDLLSKAKDNICGVLFESEGPEFKRERLTAGFLLAEIFIRRDETAAALNILKNIAEDIEGLKKFPSKKMIYYYLYSLLTSQRGNDNKKNKYYEKGERLRKELGIARPDKWLPGSEKDLLPPARRKKKAVEEERVAEGESLYISGNTMSRKETAGNEFITVNNRMKKLLESIKGVSGTPLPILLRGNTGTGKDLIAGMIHKWSGRGDKPFVPVNVAALSPSLFESSLFGHVKGAFTGAVRLNRGFVEASGDGTIFLDEIGELRADLQAKLLRYLDSGEYHVVGGTEVKRGTARIVAATNKNLESAIERGTFRMDLYHRLNVFNFMIPSLKERKDDIKILAEYFIRKACCEFNISRAGLSKNACDLLKRYSWPGNVRELQNEVLKALFNSKSGVIRASDLSVPILSELLIPNNSEESSLDGRIAAMERGEIIRALREAGGNRSMAARILGLERTTLIYRIKRYGLN